MRKTNFSTQGCYIPLGHWWLQIISYDMIVQEVIIIPLCSKCSLKVAKKLNYESLIILTVPI